MIDECCVILLILHKTGAKMKQIESSMKLATSLLKLHGSSIYGCIWGGVTGCSNWELTTTIARAFGQEMKLAVVRTIVSTLMSKRCKINLV